MNVETQKGMDVSPLPAAIAEPLTTIVRKHWGRERFVLWCGLAAFSLATFLIMIVVDLWLEIDSGNTRLLGLFIASCTVAGFAFCWSRSFDRTFGMMQAAWRLERFFPHLNERVISMVSLTGGERDEASRIAGSTQLISALGRETAEKLATVDTNLIPVRSRRSVTICTAMVSIMILVVAMIQPDAFLCSLRNWLFPWAAPVFPELPFEMEPGDATVKYGDDLLVTAVDIPASVPAVVEFENENDSRVIPLAKGTVRSVILEDLCFETTYRLRIGKRTSRNYIIRVLPALTSDADPENFTTPQEETKPAEAQAPDDEPVDAEPEPSFSEIAEQQEELQQELDATREKIDEALQSIEQANEWNEEKHDAKEEANELKVSLLKKASESTAEGRELAKSLASKIDRSNIDLQDASSDLRELSEKELSDAKQQLDSAQSKEEKSEQSRALADARDNLDKAKRQLDDLEREMAEKRKTLAEAAKLEELAREQRKLTEEIADTPAEQEPGDKQAGDKQAGEPLPKEWKEKQEQIRDELKEMNQTDQTDQTDQQQRKQQQMGEACEKCDSAANAGSCKEAKENAQSAADKLAEMVAEIGRQPSLLKNCEKCRNPGSNGRKPGTKEGVQPNGTKTVTERPFERLPLRGGASSGWTGAKRQLKSSGLEGREAMIPEAYRDVVMNYFEELASESTDTVNSSSLEKKTPQQ